MRCPRHEDAWTPGCRDCLTDQLRITSDSEINGNRLFWHMKLNGLLKKRPSHPQEQPAVRKPVVGKRQHEL